MKMPISNDSASQPHHSPKVQTIPETILEEPGQITTVG